MPDIVTARTFTDGEKGITATKLNEIQSKAVIQPDLVGTRPASSSLVPDDQLLVLKTNNTLARAAFSLVASASGALIPLADPTQSGMLRQVSGKTTDVVDGTNNCVDLASSPAIGMGRLRSFNAVGNPNFEVDSRTAGTGTTAAGTYACDRWILNKSGATMAVTVQQTAGAAGEIILPGTSFAVSRRFMRFTLNTAQASLAATDLLQIYTPIEGPILRELFYDVHSISLLVRSSVAGLNFGVSIKDPATSTKSLVKLATIPTANTWTLLTFPNLPVFPSGNFSLSPGALGYYVIICLAAGTSYIAPANDTWQNGSYSGAAGQDNFASKALGSTFDVAFVQHEPGPKCTTLIDKPFTVNLDECLRYFSKSYDYAVKPGTIASQGVIGCAMPANFNVNVPVPFPKRMAKDPTVYGYSSATGNINGVRDATAATDRVISSVYNPGETGFSGFVITTVNASAAVYYFHWVADTGW